jgi:hypothetical protein
MTLEDILGASDLLSAKKFEICCPIFLRVKSALNLQLQSQVKLLMYGVISTASGDWMIMEVISLYAAQLVLSHL